MPDPKFEAFAKEVMAHWPGDGPDGFELQDLAVKHNMIAEIPGGYDPDTHFDAYGVEPEKGDQWFERNYS